MQNKYELSLIILTFNSSKKLSLLLTSLTKQTFDTKLVQIIIVDDGSTDETESIVRKYSDHLIIDYQKIEHTGNRGHNRNFGASKAKANRLLFIDGDSILARDFLELHERGSRDPNALTMGRRIRLMDNPNGPINEELICNHYDLLDQLPSIDDERLLFKLTLDDFNINGEDVFAMMFSHNFCVSKERFDASGGFDPAFSVNWGAEDVELGYRLVKNGCRLKLDMNIKVYHFFVNEDIVKKIKSLRKNLQLFFQKHSNWEIELACLEHKIHPRNYLLVREKVKNKTHLVQHTNSDISKLLYGKKVLNVGVNAFLESCRMLISTEAPAEFKGSYHALLGTNIPSEDGAFDICLLSHHYLKIGKTFWDLVVNEALRCAHNVILVDECGIINDECSSNEGNPIFYVPKYSQKVLITTSDSNNLGRNKYYLHELGLALNKIGVDVGFLLLGDVKNETDKFLGFYHHDNKNKRSEINRLYQKDLTFLDGEIPNIMDGVMGGGISRSIDHKILWQENIAENMASFFFNESEKHFDRIFTRRKSDEYLGNKRRDFLPVGIDAEHLASIYQQYEPDSKVINFLWISWTIDELCGIEQLMDAYTMLLNTGKKVKLTIIAGNRIVSDKPHYLNDAGWFYSRKTTELLEFKAEAILKRNCSKIAHNTSICIHYGNFGLDFITKKIAEADVIIDTCQYNYIQPWILSGFALSKKIIRFSDGCYRDYLPESALIPIEFDYVSGIYEGPYPEIMPYGPRLNNRYFKCKRAKTETLYNQMLYVANRIDEFKEKRMFDYEFADNFSWDRTALLCRDLLES